MSLRNHKNELALVCLIVAIGTARMLLSEEDVPAGPDGQPQANDSRPADVQTNPPSPGEELARLQGTWVAHFEDSPGLNLSPFDEHGVPRYVLIIAGNECFSCPGDSRPKTLAGQLTSHLRINPTTTPKSIDRSATGAFTPGQVLHGVYELDGDVLRWQDGPKELARRPGQLTEGGPRVVLHSPRTVLARVAYWQRLKP
jgi:uncharacterized protein (TIGR03067 family)